MQYTQQEYNEGVSRLRADPQEARIPPPPSCSPPRFTPLAPNNKHYVLSEVELATFRTQLCESHQRNRCAHPDACPHSHCMTWQRRNPYEIIYDPHLCPGIEFRRSNSKMSLIRHCTRGRSCAYAHSKEEELYHPLMYKTKLCTVFPKCDRHYCPFAHSTEEMRHPFNNPLIHYIWGSSSGLDCGGPNDMVQRWALSPLASLSRPLLITENTQLPSISRGPLQEESIYLSQHQQQLHLQHQHLQVQQQQQLRHQQQQEQIAQQGMQQRWQQDSHQTPQTQSGKQLHSFSSPAAAPPPLYSFTMQQQQQQQRQSYSPGVAKQISMRSITKQARPNYNVKQSILFPSVKAVQGSQMTVWQQSHLSRNSEIFHTLKTAGEAESAETSEGAGKGRRPPAVQESLLGQPFLAQKVRPTAEIEIHDGIERNCRENQRQTLPASSEAVSATTTTASTDLQDLLDSESVRRALIMTLAQQLIGPQVNQLSVDQVLIVLDLAVKLAAQLQPTTPSVSVFTPSSAEELLRLQQTESDSPQQGSSVLTNTVTLSSSSAASQQGKLSGSSSSGSPQSEDLLLQQQQQQRVAEASASASHATRSGVTSAAHPATTDNLLADTTSPASFDPHPHDIDPVASLAATHALIEQLRKLSFLDVGEEVSHNCSSPAPSLEEADTSSLSIVRGSSTAVWSTSTSPIVGGGSDLSSRYATTSVRHGDLAPSTAIAAAATTFASASSNADEASLCACPSLTIAQDLNTGADKHHHFLHMSPAPTTAGDSNTRGTSGGASAAPCFPSSARGKVCASPVDGVFRQQHGRLANRGGRGGEIMCSATNHRSTKTPPAFSSAFGGKDESPYFRGLLPPPGTYGVDCNEEEAPADTSSASCPLQLAGPNGPRRFSYNGANPVAGTSSPPPPQLLQQQRGNFVRSQVFSDSSTMRQQQDTSLQKRGLLTGILTSARKLTDPFSPQLTTCSHSPSTGQFSSPQYCMGGGSSTEPTPAYGTRLPDGNSSTKNNFSHSTKGSCQSGTRSSVHESKDTFSDRQCRQRVKADVPKASA